MMALAISLLATTGSMAQQQMSKEDFAKVRTIMASRDKSAAPGVISQLEASEEPHAVYLLGEIYREGALVPQDLARSVSLYEQAANAGHGNASVRLAESYVLGRGVQEDEERGLSMLTELADAGNGAPLRTLGEFYSLPGPVSPDGDKAIDYLTQAAEAGDAYALLRLGDLYRDGGLVEADPELSFQHYQEAADKGVSSANIKVAEAYLRGNGVQQDTQKGLDLLKESADTGTITAVRTTADYLKDGDYVEPDRQEAIKLYAAAAESGNTGAFLPLAAMYADEGEPAKAISFYERAIEADVRGAERQYLDRHMSGRLGRMSKPSWAASEMKRLAAEGDEDALVFTASGYYWGSGGLKRDPALAVSMLEEAASEGSLPAIRRLVTIYRDAPGNRVRKSIAKARNHLTSLEGSMDPVSYRREATILDAASEDSLSKYEQVAEAVSALPQSAQPAALSAIKNANPNVYVYIAQKRMSEAGIYGGSLNGLLTRDTIRAINTVCSQGVGTDRCKKGPLDSQAVRQVAILLSKLS